MIDDELSEPPTPVIQSSEHKLPVCGDELSEPPTPVIQSSEHKLKMVCDDELSEPPPPIIQSSDHKMVCDDELKIHRCLSKLRETMTRSIHT